MAPSIALDVIPNSPQSLRVLDPMMGSGTVLAVARAKGHRAIGVDVDPLATLLSRVWTSTIDADHAQRKASEVLDRAKGKHLLTPANGAFPSHADKETKEFIAYWFDGAARRQLLTLSNAIARVRNKSTRDVLWAAFSRLIITKQSGASRAMDLSHSRPHRAFKRAPAMPFDKFLDATDRVIKSCLDAGTKRRGPATQVYDGDARRLPLKACSIDLVLTSPPYLNAIDYLRCSKFSLVWMGWTIEQLRDIRATSVGTEVGMVSGQDDEIQAIVDSLALRPSLPPRRAAILARYVHDMHSAMKEVSRVLVPGGRAVYVVGENTVRGTFIPNSAIVSKLAEHAGLAMVDRRSRSLPANRRYLPPPTRKADASLDARMRREVILTFSKSEVPADE